MDNLTNCTYIVNTMVSDHEWPPGHDPRGSDLHCVNELTMDAPPEAVWEVLVRADRWRSIYPNALRVRHVSGPWPELASGTRWRWVTFGVPVETEIVLCERPSRLTWVGEGLGATGAHRWMLEETDDGRTRVLTDETQRGLAVKALRPVMLPAMRRLHQRWLEGIAGAARRFGPGGPP